MYYFLEFSFDGSPMIVLKPYRDPIEAAQSAMREPRAGNFRVLSSNTRDKREVWRAWKLHMMQEVTPA
jgi:hypothetical protein